MSDAVRLLALCGVVAVAVVAAIALRRQFDDLHRFIRRLTVWQRCLLALFAAVLISFGGSKTNDVDGVSGTNVVQGVDGTHGLLGKQVRPGFSPLLTPRFNLGPRSFDTSVTDEDIARGWQLWEVKTNENFSYAMPETAALHTNWWVHGAYEDVTRVNFRGAPGGRALPWRFPLGSNEYDSVWAYTWGKVRPRLADASNEIAAVGSPMSAIPYTSRLWTVATNGARFITWENFALGRIPTNSQLSTFNSQLISAQIEFRSTGDFILRSNEVETVCRHIDDFDRDGDGIPDEDDGDPYGYDGDCTGQETWWREYVDETVGSGLENGYYRLTAVFPPGDDFRRTKLTVGDKRIVVAEPGEYVFLLEKGNAYELGIHPFVEGVEFDAVDDVPGAVPRMMSGAGPSWTGTWSVDPGGCILDPPVTNRDGCVLWTPKLRVSPGGWSPTADSPSETFTAVLYDQTGSMGGTTYRWESCHGSLSVDSPDSDSTGMTWSGTGQVSGRVALLEVSVDGGSLRSELAFGFQDPGSGGGVADSDIDLVFDMTVPEALLVNSNEVSSTKVGTVRMSISGDVPSDGRLVLRCASGDERVRLLGITNRTLTCEAVLEGREFQVDIEGVQASTRLNDVELEAVFICQGGERVCGRSRLTVIDVGGVFFPDEPDDRPVVAPDTWVPFDLAVMPMEAAQLLWTTCYVRRLGRDGTAPGWTWLEEDDPYTTECGFSPHTRGVWEVKVVAGLEPEGCPYGADERDTLWVGGGPARVYVPREPRLVFDYDRDGRIDTNDVAKAKAGRTFRFWINDDNDSGDVNDSANDAPGSGPNWGDGYVNGRGDLLDFTPVWMDFSEVFPTGTPVQVWSKVEWRLESSCVNVVWSYLGRANAGSFQREGDLYDFGPQLIDLAECADVTDVSSGVVIPELLRGTSGADGGVFLIEGRAQGTNLTLKGWTVCRPARPSEWLVTSEANVSITGVEHMYRWLNLRGECDAPVGRASSLAEPVNSPDDESDGGQFVFVHGYNVNEASARAWGSEMFKRLWQSGSRNMFTAVTWYGNDSQSALYLGNTPDYYSNVEHALSTAAGFKRSVQALPGTAKYVAAHSLGNMLVSSAIADHGLVVTRYFMLNAAVPMEAYDPNAVTASSRNNMTPADWRPYALRLRANHWNELFDTGDARRDLTWKGRFATINNAVNYFSSEEDVLANADGEEHSVLSARYAWANQETRKGRWPALLPGNSEAGWSFNTGYDIDNPGYVGGGDPTKLRLTPAQAAQLSDIQLKLYPFFGAFDDMSICTTNQISIIQQTNRLVADAIPAESYAAGANPIPLWDIGGAYRNINMVTFRDSETDGDWTHSFIIAAPYAWVWQLFESIKESAGGNQ